MATDGQGLTASAPHSVPAPPVLSLEPTSSPPGSLVTVTGSSFSRSSSVVLKYGDTQVGQITTDTAGSFRTSFRVPSTVKGPSANKVVATDGQGLTASAPHSVPAPPTAAFSAEPRTGGCQFKVQFNNLSTGADSYFWDFGDDTTSTQKSPIHTYSRSGEGTLSYTITLVAKGTGGDDKETKVNYIVSQCIK